MQYPQMALKLRNCSFIWQNHLLVGKKIRKCADLWSLLLKKMEKKMVDIKPQLMSPEL